jgi:hypothetical protein
MENGKANACDAGDATCIFTLQPTCTREVRYASTTRVRNRACIAAHPTRNVYRQPTLPQLNNNNHKNKQGNRTRSRPHPSSRPSISKAFSSSKAERAAYCTVCLPTDIGHLTLSFLPLFFAGHGQRGMSPRQRASETLQFSHVSSNSLSLSLSQQEGPNLQGPAQACHRT